ncbi:MAG: hypothetical protein H7X84_04705 [Verrucomicrobia bacterium]|nr:hypothetical protein [Prolixibacteraceae bacterium]
MHLLKAIISALCYHIDSAAHLDNRVSGHSMVECHARAQKAALAMTLMWDNPGSSGKPVEGIQI